MYSEGVPSGFTAQTQWIVDNKDARNIVFVAHVGDIVNVATDEHELSDMLDRIDELTAGASIGPHASDELIDAVRAFVDGKDR